MADKLMYIPNDFEQNYHFCRLELVVSVHTIVPIIYILALYVDQMSNISMGFLLLP